MKTQLSIAMCLLLATSIYAQHFEPTFESLQQYKCPEWIQKAKFGIYSHWNAYAASKSPNNGWYARQMYEEGSSTYKDHLKNWGHPSKVGYKDVVKAWNADKFNAKEWVRLYKEAGAKFIVTMAVHHDNFDMWNSKYQPRWNATHYGPKTDVCKAIREETLKAGLRWGVTTHLERSYGWVQTNKGADKKGPFKGVPYDGNMKEYQDLYLEYPNFKNLGPEYYHYRSPLVSPQAWKEHWKNRLEDLISNYHPDFCYIDGALPYTDDGGKIGMEILAFYYNHNAKMHNGKNEGFFGIKNILNHGVFYPNITSCIMERKYADYIEDTPKLTEDSLGPWFYIEGAEYKSVKRIIASMADAVAKNCIFMLNVPPMGNGDIDERARAILSEIGGWMKVNGDAIYDTKPWKTFGEGSVRFTTKENTLNVIVCSELKGNVLLASLKGWNKDDIKAVRFLGSDEKIKYTVNQLGVILDLPKKIKGAPAYVFQIVCKDLKNLPFQKVNLESVKKINEEAAKKYGATGNNGMIPLS